ncbi:hypothetical protein GUITHDRAFT_107563 [Guillardia theta CCMP2712]|uniref:acid phosphatase n=1 Tax=Guillardia theta (strain CCMP2712) TaxID=905079 RepID=L1JF97_GUITC|nr:hypothetical protein GUITHDRAFT_107563 [Guillardia theta CCMP2712]EKX46789.1 hypothetical protein GUITHDRAFT_107563 [Guillardia theta CCMP2712]|eukprot:XP_005833769.1 hypothetical protein GUITHDRAFT_107563 [Guillardia theta CCMP2712]
MGQRSANLAVAQKPWTCQSMGGGWRWGQFSRALPLSVLLPSLLDSSSTHECSPSTHVNKIVYFVCTSNTCRSPMAEVIAKRWLAERHQVEVEKLEEKTGWVVRSAGLTEDYEKAGSPASANSITAMKKVGITLANHSSKMLKGQDVEEALAIFCITARHRDWVLHMFPTAETKVRVLERDVEDPWHKDQVAYDVCASQLLEVVPRILAKEFSYLIEAETRGERVVGTEHRQDITFGLGL